MLVNLFRKLLKIGIVLLIIGLINTQNKAYAQLDKNPNQVSVHLTVQSIGETEILSLINGKDIYLPVAQLFDYLHISNQIDPSTGIISGIFIEEQTRYSIDIRGKKIHFKDKVYQLDDNELLDTIGESYLRVDHLGKIFGLNCIFNFSDLSVIMSTNLELPAVREMRKQRIRQVAQMQLKVKVADTLIGLSNQFFNLSTVDYSFYKSYSTQKTYNATNISLGFGGLLAQGETNVLLNYRNQEGLAKGQQYYAWRKVNNKNAIFKQINIGNIQPQSISSLYAPLVGILVTNAPTTYQRSFGTYAINSSTGANFTVELYVNDVLIGYTQADAAGSYSFIVPLTYGNMSIKLRFYGTDTMESLPAKFINLPFNFLPKHQFEYSAATGILGDITRAHFSRLTTNYGISTNFAVGGGIEYLSSITNRKYIPFLNTSLHLLKNFMFTSEYAPLVRYKALLSYNLPSGFQLEIGDSRYHKDQQAIVTNMVEDRRIMAAIPFRTRKFAGYTRFSANHIILPNSSYLTLDWMASASIERFSISTNTHVLKLPNSALFVNTNLSLSFRGPMHFLLTQLLQYDFAQQTLALFKTEFEKRFSTSSYLTLSYQENLLSKTKNIEFGLKYDLPFLKGSSSVLKSNQSVTYAQAINGSLFYDAKANFAQASSRSSVGKGALLFLPYLDLDANGTRSLDEPYVAGLTAVINGGLVSYHTVNGSISITDLQGYGVYDIEMDPTGFESVAWKLVKKNYQVTITPNLLKQIEVPILVLGEASGKITSIVAGEEKGIGRLTICFYSVTGKMVASTLSELDGTFNYMGLLPGYYTVNIATQQLGKLNLVANPGSLSFHIQKSLTGSMVEHLDFKLK